MKNLKIIILFLLPMLSFSKSPVVETSISKSSQVFLDAIRIKFLKSDTSSIQKKIMTEVIEYIPKRTEADIKTEESEPCHKVIHDVLKDQYRSDRCSTVIYKSPKILKFAIKNKLCPTKVAPLSDNAFTGGALRGLMNHNGKELLILWFLDAC